MPMCTQHAMMVTSNTSAGVSNIAQIPDGQKRQVKIIDTPSQSVRSSIQAVPETHPGVRGLAPRHWGESAFVDACYASSYARVR